jgi:hypothetical protein
MYKCIACNLNITSVGNFKAHVITKKHLSNLTKTQETTQPESQLKEDKKQKKQLPKQKDKQLIKLQTEQSGEFKCKICKKSYYSNYNLERHRSSCKGVVKILKHSKIKIIDNLDLLSQDSVDSKNITIVINTSNINNGTINNINNGVINNVVNNNIQCPNNATVTTAASTITIPTSAYRLPDFSFWGLPGYLGFGKCNISSTSSSTATNNTNAGIYNSIFVPRFYYGNALNPGDNGYWLLPNPNLTNSQVYWLETPYKINIFGPSQMYMEIDGNNCIDETSPYNLSPFTLTTNQTNGIVNASFAKIPVPTTPLSQWFDKDRAPYKFYYPPAERMRKFHIRLRYHNGELVNFGNFEFNITLEFTLQQPQLLRNYRNTLIYPKAT